MSKRTSEIGRRLSPAYAGISLQERTSHAGILNGRYAKLPGRHITQTDIPHELSSRALEMGAKIIAAAIIGANEQTRRRFGSRLWREQDIVPVFDIGGNDIRELAEKTSKRFTQEGVPLIVYGPHREVIPSDFVTVADYQDANPAYVTALNQAQYFGQEFVGGKGNKIIHINSTAQGGGVALMRHAEIRLARQMGLDMHWHVMTSDPEDMDVFNVTKGRMHNAFQGVATENITLTDNDKATYQKWIAKNAAILEPAYKDAAVVVIDDYQPSGLIPYILKVNPGVKIIYRSHIQIESSLTDDPTKPQHDTWQYLWDGGIKYADAFVSHPMKGFVPETVPMDSVVAMGATTDPFDGLNKQLTPDQMDYYLGEVDRLLVEQNSLRQQSAVDHSRPFITQIARFDPSKGIDHLISSFALTWQKMKAEGKTCPQLVIAGHSAIDDPDGNRIYKSIMDTLALFEPELANDIKILRAPHIDQVLGAIMQGARFATQLSTREGFEIKVTEALMKGKPIIASDQGGIPLQVTEGESGFIVNPLDHMQVSNYMYRLLTDDAEYSRMRGQAIRLVNPDYTTTQNLANWLYLAKRVIHEGKVTDGNFASVPDLARADFEYAKAGLGRRRVTRSETDSRTAGMYQY